jgi:chemosensory pili system protein ChpA (sensor histidine kinase/response regulator)
MPSHIDPTMLTRFVKMARSSMPQIRANIVNFLQDETQQDALEEAYQDLQPLKDAIQMLGLVPLYTILASITEMIEDLAAGPLPVPAERGAHLLKTVEQVEPYLECLLVADGNEDEMVQVAVLAYRRFQGLPEDGDAASVAELSAAQDAVMAPEATASPAAEPTPRDEAPGPAVGATPHDDLSAELREGFLLEAEELLDSIGRTLPNIDGQPEHRDRIQQVRRSVHTLKGAAGVVGFRAVSQLAHRMEDVLDELYDGHLQLTPQTRDLLLATFDTLDDFLRDKSGQGDFEQLAQPLYDSYQAILGGAVVAEDPTPLSSESAAPVPAAAAPAMSAVPISETLASATQHQAPVSQDTVASQPADVIRVPLDRLDNLVRLVSELVISRSVYERHLGRLIRQVEELGLSIDRLRRITSTIETQYEASMLLSGPRGSGLHAVPGRLAMSSDSREVEFDELEFDRYTEFHLVSRELSETTADIGALGQEFNDILGDFDGYLTRQSRLTSEVQDKLMQLRMVPLTTLATRLHRTVRVTATQQEKDVAFSLEGEEVEFDKTMLEEMAEPLLHLLRNAVDHGIEPPTLRRELGKPQQGQIRLRAFREGTQIVIQVQDDGVGLDPQRLRTAAVQKGFMSETEVAQLSDEQLYALVFMPGFSTAAQVSEISGRGVGMDIVHATVSRLKGRITLASTPGQGSTCTIRLPLTLAIARVLLVKSHGETFAIPLADVTQILRLEPEAIEQVGGSPVVRVDGDVLPVLRLGEQLRLQQPADSTVQHLPIVVTQAGQKHVAIVVDQLLGGREVVVKTLGTHLRRVHGVIGSTLMGDGTIVLILNPAELTGDRVAVSTPQQATRAMARTSEALNILVVDDSFSVRRVVANLIKSVGWRPTLAKDGLEALEIIQSAARLPDLILLDVEMPQMDGYELTSTLRAQDIYRDLPIVMLTSRSGAKHREKAFEVGATEYLVKPYRDETLIEVIRRLTVRATGITAA